MDAPNYPIYAGEKLWTVMPAADLLQQHVDVQQFPPRQAPADFNPRRCSRRRSTPPARGVGNS